MLLSLTSCGAPHASSAVECAGFKPIPVSEQEVVFLYPSADEDDPPNGQLPQELLVQMRLTYTEIATHNAFYRQHCLPP